MGGGRGGSMVGIRGVGGGWEGEEWYVKSDNHRNVAREGKIPLALGFLALTLHFVKNRKFS